MSDARPIESIEELNGKWTLVSRTRRLSATGKSVLTKMTAAERAELYDTMLAYSGTFTFDGKIAAHHVDIAWSQDWSSTTQVRNLMIEENKSVMSTNPQAGIDGRRSTGLFVWMRLENDSRN